MDRREFLQASATVCLGVAAGLARSETVAGLDLVTDSVEQSKMKGKYWIWSDTDKGASSSDLKQKYRKLRAHGLEGLFIGGGLDDREFDIIKEAGLEIHCWMWTTNRGDQWIRDHHPDWYMVSRTGKSCFDNPPYVDYYRWISPVIPGVQNFLLEKAGELARHPAVSGVHLDYVRYPDVILPRALWEHYHLDQTEELPDYDFCYSEHTRAAFKKETGRDPMDIEVPAIDQQWLHFRYDSVTHLVKKLAKEVHGHGKKITAAVFPTPSQARKICRQDWDKWPLDAACPMTYHSFYNEPLGWIGDCMRENVQAATFPIFAGLYMPAFSSPEEFKTAIKLVHKRGGAGLSLFGGVSDEYWAAFQETIAQVWG